MRTLSDIEHVRLRPGMYLGGTDLFGLIQFIVAAFDVLLDHGATSIEIEFADEVLLSSDAQIPTLLNERGDLEPFEALGEARTPRSLNATVLTALSQSFRFAGRDGATETILVYERGKRQLVEHQRPLVAFPGTRFELVPDNSIFTVTAVSPAVVHSYCKRTACLHPGVMFRVKTGDETTEYRCREGIRDFFNAIATPYQILHQPIYIRRADAELCVECIFAIHSEPEYQIWSFSNKERVTDGGTHEAGFLDAIRRWNRGDANAGVGALAVLAIEYPRVIYTGCTKNRVANFELRERVFNLINLGLHDWVRENEREAGYFRTIARAPTMDAL